MNWLPAPAEQGRIDARPPDSPPAPPTGLPPGEHLLGLGQPGARDGVLYVPARVQPETPAPLLVCLHGAGGTGARSIIALKEHAERHGILLLGPDSRDATWDVLRGGYGPDVTFIDAALTWLFARFTVDPARTGIEGFSDGASYALSLGIANGGLFSHILAFSPGFMAPPAQEGQPRIFVSHGDADRVLPIDHCSRRLVPILQRAGYDIRYREFSGPHTVPPAIAQMAVSWFVAEGTGDRRPGHEGSAQDS